MNDIKKEAPFKINVSKEMQKQMAKDLENVENLKSAIHFIKNYKNYIIVNKKFKRKMVNFSLKTIAGLSSLVIAMTLINNLNKKEPTTDNTKQETKIEEINNEYIGPILSPASINGIMEAEQNNNIQSETSTQDELCPTMTISFPKASDTNETSDYENYYKVKDKYGLYIDKLSKESGVDSRIIIAMIAQENPNGIDQTNVGTYGPMCVTSVHNGETYNYGYYNSNGEFVNETVTIDINNLKYNSENNQLYENGEYGNITKADAMCIFYGVVIIKSNEYQISKSNDNLLPEENFILSLGSFNHGYPDIIRCTKDFDNLFDASYSIRYNHAGDNIHDDDQYLEHVLNKIPDEELTTPFIFTDNNGNTSCFILEKNNDLATVSSSEIINNKKSI